MNNFCCCIVGDSADDSISTIIDLKLLCEPPKAVSDTKAAVCKFRCILSIRMYIALSVTRVLH